MQRTTTLSGQALKVEGRANRVCRYANRRLVRHAERTLPAMRHMLGARPRKATTGTDKYPLRTAF